MTALAVIILLGLSALGLAFFVGRKLFLSWKQPYKRASDSLHRLPHTSVPFLQEFSQHPEFRRWLHQKGRQETGALAALFCAADERMREYVLAALPKQDQKRLHHTVKHKKSFSKEELERTALVVRSYLDEEYRSPAKKPDLDFYSLYFYEEYGETLQYIAKQQRLVNPALQETITGMVASVLQSIPFYRERRLYEQQHKLEMFLTKDLPDMLGLVAQLSPAQRRDKEQELASFLIKFQKEIEESENSMYINLGRALDIKMRAAEEKLHKN
nr:DUF3974 domain-containing protein [Ectobacillus ponti]